MKNYDIDKFIQNGGKITQCPTINNNHDRKKINKNREKENNFKINSAICNGCKNNFKNKRTKKLHCKGTCNPLLWINGTEETQEQFYDDLKHKPPESANYNQALSELINNQIYLSENEPEIKDVRKRAISVLVKNNFTLQEIALKIMKITVKHLRRISR